MSKSNEFPRSKQTSAKRTELTVLVGIPAYNESTTVAEVVNAAQNHADEVLVVDDGSDDPTVKRAMDAGANVIAHEANEGYGSTLGTIFEYADSYGPDHLVILDADGQHDAGDIPELVKTQQETGAQVVTGSRFSGNSSLEIPLYRRFGLAVINLFTNISLRVGYSHPSVTDTQCGFRAYDREAIKTMASTDAIGSGMGASLDILFQTAQEGYDIAEVPTRIDYHVEDANTQNPVIHGLSLLKSLFVSVIRDRPARIVPVGGVLLLVTVASIFALARTDLTPVFLIGLVLFTLAPIILFKISKNGTESTETTDR